MFTATCPFCQDERCFTDRHHHYWPRRSYRTPLEREFRTLFIEVMWRCQHERIHKLHPPRKPRRKVMERVVKERRASRARELQRV